MGSIITIENLGKKYTIGHQRNDNYLTFRDSLSDLSKSLYQRIRHPFTPIQSSSLSEEFWALKDVNLTIQPGDRLGIIGRNGAGKSTLLKILSRITHPTTGRVHIKGRVTSLLEVGTGFHPELTGRENIFLNGAILGMTKNDINKCFDEIVDFAGIEKFLGTPVKRFSSGMYIRLAFSVAAHLRSEILIVDEVLAVGDAEFQKKCLNKMKGLKRKNQTVIFVSHDTGAISDICTNAIHLDMGMIINSGMTKTVVQNYMNNSSNTYFADLSSYFKNRTGSGPMRFVEAELTNSKNERQSKFTFNNNIYVNFSISGIKIGSNCIVGISVRDLNGYLLLHINNTDSGVPIIFFRENHTIRASIPSNTLNNGKYFITLWLGDGLNILHDRVENCLVFEIDNSLQGMNRCVAPIIIQGAWEIK